jgi:hypothetical protein
MPDEPQSLPAPEMPQVIEMPRSTAGPMILGLGIVLLSAGIALSPAISIVGGVIFAAGLAVWVGQLLPGRGHGHEPRVPPSQRPQQIPPAPGMVEQMQEGMPGYRMRLPLKVHPISAGVKGGLLGGLLMPIPALLWGLVSRHGIWYPINLLAGMINPSVGNLPVPELERFHLGFLLVGLVIHAIMSVVIGLVYGVLLPTLPPIRGGQIIWGGVVLPLLWTGASYGLMGVINPLLQRDVDWPWFIASQFVFGIAAAIVVIRSEKITVPPAGPGPDSESSTR